MTEQISLNLNYPKQSGPHYQRYGHETIEGDTRCEDLRKRVRYSSLAGGTNAHYVDSNGVHFYDYNVSGEFDNFRGEKLLREDIRDTKGTGRLIKTQRLREGEV